MAPEQNIVKTLGYPDFNEDGFALAAGPFKCPKCGGHTFGSSRSPEGKVEKGFCHNSGCDFKWNRADDRNYFASTS